MMSISLSALEELNRVQDSSMPMASRPTWLPMRTKDICLGWSRDDWSDSEAAQGEIMLHP